MPTCGDGAGPGITAANNDDVTLQTAVINFENAGETLQHLLVLTTI